jgi:hypothetical protein
MGEVAAGNDQGWLHAVDQRPEGGLDLRPIVCAQM